MSKPKSKPVRPIARYGATASESLGLPYHLIPWESMRRVAAIFAEGLRKYPDTVVNARHLDRITPEWLDERYCHAIDHLAKWQEGNRNEDHLAKVAWFCLIALTRDVRKPEGGQDV